MGNVFTRRAIAFLLAVALAIVAALAVYNYIREVEREATDEQNLVEGYRATSRIEVGTLADTAIQSGSIEQVDIPRELLAPEAITSEAQIAGRVVQETILPGDQIVTTRFAAPGEVPNVLTIPPDHQALSFQVGVQPGLAGFLRRGDHISIIVNVESEGADTGQPAPDPDADTSAADQDDLVSTQARTQYLLQDVEILAVGRRVPPTDEDSDGDTAQDTGGILLTVAVTPIEAEQLVYGQNNGSFWLTLLPEDETEPVTTPGRTIENLFDDN